MATKFMNGLDLQGQRAQNAGDPSSAQDLVTLSYLQNFLNGLRWKNSVRVASTGNLAISAPGASIDGVALTAGDRVLAKNQTTGSENGIYVWNGAAVAMTRAADADSGTELADGTAVFVGQGTTQANTSWVQTADDPVTIGTTATTWAQFGGGTSYTAGNGIDITGTAVSVKLDTASGLSLSGSGLKVDTATVVRKFAQNVGDGTSTSIAVTHSLGTRDVTVEVFDSSTFAKVLPDIVHTDTNNVTLVFAVAPPSNAYRVVVHG